jgi:hypothetical protein
MKSHGWVDNIENCEENQRLLQDNQKPDGWDESTYIELGIEDNLHAHAHTQENGS